MTLRDPSARGWPREGPRTEFEDVARSWAHAYVRRLLRSSHKRQAGIPDQAPKVRDVTEPFLEHRRNTRSTNTWAADRTAMMHMTENFQGDRLDEIDYQGWADGMIREGYKRVTIRQYMISIRKLHDFVGLDPPSVMLKDEGSMGVTAWSDEELRALRNAAKTLGMAERLERALATGMRRNELMACRWEDFNPFTKTVLVARQRKKYSDEVKAPKGKRPRTSLVLPEYWEHHDATKTGRIDPPRSITMMNADFRAILDEAGLQVENVGWHSCRHAFARVYLERYGGDLMQLASFLGHSSVEVTRRYYGHFSSDAAVRLGRLAVYGEA